jgi:hypothetical protein
MKFEYHWYEESRMSIAILKDKGKEWHGTAFCHTDDADFCSQHTGMIIAEMRAMIEFYKDRRKMLRNEYNALDRLYRQMTRGADCSVKSREMKILQAELRRIKNELATASCGISQIKSDLKDFIDTKEQLYTQIRAKRKVEAH